MPVVLQITFRKGDSDENPSPDGAAAARAHKIANDVPGCKEGFGCSSSSTTLFLTRCFLDDFVTVLWKIWISQPDQKVYGGTYLFESTAAAEAYLASPIPDDIRHEPDFTTTIFEIEEEFSAITHAPLQRPTK